VRITGIIHIPLRFMKASEDQKGLILLNLMHGNISLLL